MRIRLIITACVLVAFGAAWMLQGRGRADSYTYSSVKRQVRVAIVVSSAQLVKTPNGPQPENPDPHVFYVLENRTDLKPAGVEFLNPLAPPTITPDIYKRWRDRVINGNDPAFDPNSASGSVFHVGSRVTKDMGAYWELNLDSTSAEQLQQFDLLLLASHKGDITFTPEQREKLRKFVEQGGTLWVENCGGMNFSPYSQFLFDVQINSGNLANAAAVVGAPNHPLLTYPNVLTPQEVQSLGDKNVNACYLYAINAPTDTAPGPNAVNPPGEQTLVPVVWNTLADNVQQPQSDWRPYILAGTVGKGRIVFNAGGSADAINDYVGGAPVGYGGNSGAISGQNLQGAHSQDLKFAYNLAMWSSTGNTTQNSDVRRTGATNERLAPVLGELWNVPVQGGNAAAVVGGSTFYKFAVFSVDSNLVLHCYDANPARDLDGDGNTDDGLLDYISGTPYDEVWHLDLKQISGGATGASVPTVVEFYDPTFVTRHGNASNGLANFNERELCIVELSDGTIVAARAFPRQAKPNLPLAGVTNGENVDWTIPTGRLGTVDPGFASGAFRPVPVPAVAWSEGVVFASVTTSLDGGRVLAIDPKEGDPATNPFTQPWSLNPGRSVAPGVGAMPPFAGAPTVGYVRDTGSGASDKMIYVQALQSQNGGNRAQSILGFWFGTKGEPLNHLAGNTFSSRSPIPWYGTVGGGPVDNLLLRPRVFWHYHDPASGAIYDRELDYTQNNAPANNQFTVTWDTAARAVRILIGSTIPPQGGSTFGPDDPNSTFFADYTLDWAQTDNTKPQINARATFIHDPGQAGAAQIGGSPALTADDLLVYGVDFMQTGNQSSGRGAVFAVNEQFGQIIAPRRNLQNGPAQNNIVIGSRMPWAYMMHDGFVLTYGNGQTLTVPPRLRQLDEIVAKVTNTQPGEYLTNVRFHGTPAVKDGVVYAVADAVIGPAADPATAPANRQVSVVCAFKANPAVDLHLLQGGTNTGPLPQDAIANVWQMNVNPPPGIGVQVGGGSNKVILQNSQLTLDTQNGIVHITSMSPVGSIANNFASNSMPFVVSIASSTGSTPETAIYGTIVDSWIDPNTGKKVIDPHIVGPPGIDNLMWYAVIPTTTLPASPIPSMGFITSSPQVQGNVIWLGFLNGYIASLDADPGASEPEFQATGAQARLYNPDPTVPTTPLHLRWTQPLFDTFAQQTGPPVLVPPAGTANVLAASNAQGLFTYQDALTIIADNKRLVEVNAAGEATWTSDSTRTHGVAGGDLPQYGQDNNGNIGVTNPASGTGVPVVHNVPYARPSEVKKISDNAFLVVDTGNNRVAQIDRGSNVVWEVHRFFDDFKHLLRPGDPLTLNEPADCSYWSEFVVFTNQNPLQANVGGTIYSYVGPATVVHYLIADTGNFRIVELVDAYDNGGRPITLSNNGNAAPFSMLRQLNFVSSSYGIQGKKLRYRTVQRLLLRNGDLPQEWQDSTKGANDPVRLTLAAVSNFRQVGDPNVARQPVNTGGETVESGGGSLVLLSEAGLPLSVISNLRIPDGNGFRIQPIVNPTWYSVFQEVVPVNGTPTLYNKYLLADANGCYQLTTGPDPRYLNVEWMLSANDYYAMTGKRLQAASLRRLSSAVSDPKKPGFGLHHYLITNRATGQDNPSAFGITYNTNPNNPAGGNISGPAEFHGEVFEVSPDTFDITKPFHGYIPDYQAQGNFLLPNDGNNGRPKASIVWRTPTETVPTAWNGTTGQVGAISRRIGDPTRATTTSLLEQPAFADRPF